ncbi:hypothetical protein FQA39_LY14743 [Lamprigera yunnana]|nr:hypothetical protein FQA39_LY14743 [Lamprigera yunnana]
MTDSEDDYMSDKLLLGCEKEDVRPGLLFNKTQKRNHEIYKQKQDAKAKKPKRYIEQEQEMRDQGLSTAISEDNKGFQLLQKMGYKSGSGLGKTESGISKPIDIKLKHSNTGLGVESYITEMKDRRRNYKKKVAKECEETFLTTNAEKRVMVRLQKDYFKAKRICEELDFKNAVKEPKQPFFWTKETMRAKRKKEKGDSDEESDEEEEEEEEEQIDDSTLNEIIHYLRSEYGYCMYCVDYVDKNDDDVPAYCPGFYRVDHDDLYIKLLKMEEATTVEVTEENIENTNNEEQKLKNNPYAYLDREEFSSEKFKIVVKNLPKYYGVSELRKLINGKLKLSSNKIKFPRKNSSFVFVCFRSEQERENGLKIINEYKWKGRLLTACEAKPAPDPLVKRRNELDDETTAKKVKLDEPSQEVRIKLSTIPLWDTPYEEQLKIKEEEAKNILIKLGNILKKDNPFMRDRIHAKMVSNNQLPCDLLNIRHFEQHDGYRNKCEFTVGIDEETALPTVGFRISSYAKGGTGVAPVDNLRHISEEMKIAVKVFQTFVRNYDLEVFNPESQTGSFRQLMVRHAAKQLMLIVGIHPQTIAEDKISQLKKDLIDYFFEGPGKEAKVTSLYYQKIIKKTSSNDKFFPEHLHGDTHIEESILGLKFRVSPEAFFQINTKAAEILYKSAIELSEPTSGSTVLDICCGTGTIGLCFAKSCSLVLGIEVIKQAIEDAKENAKNNSIENCEFFCGKAEDILDSVLYKVKDEDVIAVVDPPRAGMHQKAILKLRKATKIKKLIYISCNAKAAMKNFIDLCRRPSKTLDGVPFVPVKAVTVDLFPHTKLYELIILFERWNGETE